MSINEFGEIELISKNQACKYSIQLLAPDDSDYKILFTQGLADVNQKVDEELKDFMNIELYFCLPDYWNLKEKDWPVFWLNRIAKAHQEKELCFGPGDTLSAKDGEKSIADYHGDIDIDLKGLNYFLLTEPILINKINSLLHTEDKVRYLAVIPIFKKEFDYKMRNSATVLIERLKEKTFTEKINIYRKSVCRKRILGMF